LSEISEEFDTQDANNLIEVEAFDKETVSRVFIEKKIRLETIKPEDQASKIFTQLELDAMTSCYLCGFKFKDRISATHNQRWGYTHNPITSSYDHTAPINFSFIVSRIPSQYYILADYEKNYLKVNGQYACFHCNFTKSQRMFIRCPKDAQGNIDFQKFESNTEEIGKFLTDLWQSNSEWSLDSKKQNTLSKCIYNKYKKRDADQWTADRLASIMAYTDAVCNMIKNNIDQTSVTKRFYYTKLLIKKAKDLLKVDEYMTNPDNLERRRQRYAKKFIAHFVAKAEATDPMFVKPWKGFQPGINPSKSVNKQTKRVSGSSRKRKNKRKTYRRIKLF